MASSAQRWRIRQLRRLARDASALENRSRAFSRSLDKDDGPYADEARDLARAAVDLAVLAGRVDGMQEVTDLMTEET